MHYRATNASNSQLHALGVPGNVWEQISNVCHPVCFRVGDPDLGWSDEFNFTMPPEAHQVLLPAGSVA